MANKKRKVAIIMDGNGRWAEQHNNDRTSGHRRGVSTAENIISAAPELNISELTLFAFAEANWKRESWEVSALMKLFAWYIDNKVAELHKNGVRLRFIGSRCRLNSALLQKMAEAEKLTANNTGLSLNVAIDYDGSTDVTEATRRIAELVGAGQLKPGDIDKRLLRRHLSTAHMSDVDVVIRTAVEENLDQSQKPPKPRNDYFVTRPSAFLSYEAAQAVWVATATLWPDFTPDMLTKALEAAQLEKRLFGGQRRQVVGRVGHYVPCR